MAFTGSATIKRVTDRMFRITGLSLGIGASGTIGLDGGTGDVDLDTKAAWGPYVANASVSLADAVDCEIRLIDGAVTVAPAVGVVKSGTSLADFLLTLTNLGPAATGNLEIYVEFH